MGTFYLQACAILSGEGWLDVTPGSPLPHIQFQFMLFKFKVLVAKQYSPKQTRYCQEVSSFPVSQPSLLAV